MFNIKKPSKTEFQEIRIPAGKHAARPFWFDYDRREQFGMQIVFTDYARYSLPYPDSMDWNKLCGLSFCLFANHKNSVMVGWRYNSKDDVFELGFYYHKNGARMIRRNNENSEVWATAPVSGLLRIRFDVDHLTGVVTGEIETEAGIARDAVQMKTSRRSRIINTWFGGNRAAPNDIYILRKLL